MKRMVLVGVVLAVAAAACGEAGDESVATADSPGSDAVAEVTSPPSTSVAEESPLEAAPTESTGPSDDNPFLEVSPVDPSSGDDKSGGVQPPPTTAGDAVAPVEVDHPNPRVRTAIGDLVDRLGVDVSAIDVVSVEEVTWPDGSIGCPLPGMRYTQALVNGSRIVLKAGGVQYQYNSGGGREPFYCANPSDPVSGEGDYGDN